MYEYYHGVLLGNRFWTFGKYGRNKNIFLEFLNSGENLFGLKAGLSDEILTWLSLITCSRHRTLQKIQFLFLFTEGGQENIFIGRK